MSYRVSRITDPFTVRLPKPVIKAIEQIAAQEGVTRNDVAKRFIVEQLSVLEERKELRDAIPN